MAKDKKGSNKPAPKTEIRTIGRSFTNSNNPSKNFTSTSQIKVAAGTPENQIRNRVSERPAGNWANAQYGNQFGKGDIGRLQEKGFSNNEIMKIAQLAYSQGDVRKANRTSDALGALNEGFLNPRMYSTTDDGQTSYDPMMAGIRSQRAPRTALGWQGFGAPMSRNIQSGLGGYKQTGYWNMPSSLTAQGGFKPYSGQINALNTTLTKGDSSTGGETVAGGDTDSGNEAAPVTTAVTQDTMDSEFDPYNLIGNPNMRLGKGGKKRNIKSTSAPSAAQRSMPTSKTLGM